jgi:hypothetical protein
LKKLSAIAVTFTVFYCFLKWQKDARDQLLRSARMWNKNERRKVKVHKAKDVWGG